MALVFWVALAQDLISLRRDGLNIFSSMRLRLRPLLVGFAVVAMLVVTSLQSAPLVISAARWDRNAPMRMQPQSPPPVIPVIAATPLPTMVIPPTVTLTPTPRPLDPVTAASMRQEFLAKSRQNRFLGAYDPRGTLGDQDLGVEMIYTNFYPQVLAELGPQLRNIQARGRVPLVTIEPWPLTYLGYHDDTVLADINAGRYDQYLSEIATTLRSVDSPVLVRPLHEMDIAELYAWSGQPSDVYIAAYRHIYALLQRETSGNLLWIWSPAGNGNAAPYYPGDSYVDYVGFTALSSREFNQFGSVGSPQTFSAVVTEKYECLRSLGKPLLISEAGINGDPEQRAKWLSEMFNTHDTYPLLQGIVYYNDFNAINKLVPVPPDYSFTQLQWEAARRQAGLPER